MNGGGGGAKPIKLALAPKNRDEMMMRRLENQTPNGLPQRSIIGAFDFPAKPPPRHGNHSVSNLHFCVGAWVRNFQPFY